MTDPDVTRSIERVTGEAHDPETGEWVKPSEPVVEVYAQPATATGAQPVDRD
jgi:hypothetical protein